ncbi:MAG: hypothetical protein AAF399_24060 [Bacteroidota bacterium]
MSIPPIPFVLTLVLGALLYSGCDPRPDREEYVQGVQLDDLLYWSGDEEKVRAYLRTLDADLVYVSEESYPPEEEREEDDDVIYTLRIQIDNSSKLLEKSDQLLEPFSERILEMIVRELNYVEFYEDCLFSYTWHGGADTEHRDVNFTFKVADFLDSESLEYESYE